MSKYIMSFDQGTTSCRAIIVNHEGKIISQSQKEISQIYPRPGWVEHDPVEIWNSQIEVAKTAMDRAGLKSDNIVSIGITNQRETTVVWEKATGMPVSNAIVWQCRRTADYCDELKEKGLSEEIKQKTGLLIDAYFSATKLKWILDNIEGSREKAEKGELLFGTIDSWLIWKLTSGEIHATDYSNASRTMLYNINELKWDEGLLSLFDIPPSMLPEVLPTSYTYGKTCAQIFDGTIAIGSAVGDQQAALFGQRCFSKGDAKNTYGTGGFLLMNTGYEPVQSNSGLLTTIAWGIEDKISYALEGSIFVAGAAVQWLRDELKIIETAAESEKYAKMIPDNGGVYFVPAFVGLGAPHWDPYARGTITGLTRGAGRNHLIRATLEAIAYQTLDVLESMQDDSKAKLETLKADGGASENNFLMQFQADLINTTVECLKNKESTALGAAYLAGLASNYWNSVEEIRLDENAVKRFVPSMNAEERKKLLAGWKEAVLRTLAFDM